MTGGCYISGKELEVVGNILSEMRRYTGLEKNSRISCTSTSKRR
ncbi:hypothetical protein [Methanobrevibacter arboriphilus]|nr:hypothetical protein [Methanobrevibacter arboriphilus]